MVKLTNLTQQQKTIYIFVVKTLKVQHIARCNGTALMVRLNPNICVDFYHNNKKYGSQHRKAGQTAIM